MKNAIKIVAIGEVLWDMIPAGKQPGGAPANFCFHTSKLGAHSALLSSVGQDFSGFELTQLLQKKGIVLFLNSSEKQTGYVSINLVNGMPFYTIHEDTAWDFIVPSLQALDWVSKADAVCFGSLAQRSAVSQLSIELVLNKAKQNTIKVFDVNLRQHFYSEDILLKSLGLANVVKLNADELEIISKLFDLKGSPEEMCKQLINEYDLGLIALTMGSKGSLIVTQQMVSFCAVPQINVVDTIGAGDSFTAALVMGLVNKDDIKKIHREATDYAAKVCTYSGGMPDFSV